MTAIVNEWDLIENRTEMTPLPPPIEPLLAVLRQLAELLESMTDAEYVQKPVGVVASSIGGHVRHNLDHIDLLLNGLEGGEVDYDARERGTNIERDRAAALAAIGRQQWQLQRRAWALQPQSLKLRMLLAPDGEPAEMETTLNRELAFVVSHTIHHNALIAVMARLLKIPLPEDFGYAPSTLAFRKAQACVR